MNKKQRLKMIEDYEGKPKLVFERRLVSIDKNHNGTFSARVRYTITTKRDASAYRAGVSPLEATRKAWKAAKEGFTEAAAYYHKRKWEWYKFDGSPIPAAHDIEHQGHLLGLDRDGYYHCSLCDLHWKNMPGGECPKVPVFKGVWEKAFKRAEEVFGFKPFTKGQLDAAGFQTGKKLPNPCAAMEYSENANGLLFVYNPLDAVPKKTMTDAQKEALSKAQDAAKERYICQLCRNRLEKDEYGQKYCDHCMMVVWARRVLEEGALILHGNILAGPTDEENELVQLAIMHTNGDTYLSTLIQPYHHLSAYTIPAWMNATGINEGTLEAAPNIESLYQQISYIAGMGKKFIVHGWDEYIPVLEAMAQSRDLEPLEFDGYDFRRKHSQWVGVKRGRYNHRGNYTGWYYVSQPIETKDLSAFSYCEAVRELIEEMAKG